MAEWQVPPAGAKETTIVGWVNEATQEGNAWYRSQRGPTDARKALDIIAGRTDTSMIPNYRSHISTGRLKRGIREMIGALANVRPIWGYASDNPAFADNAMMMNKVTQAIYMEKFFDRSIKKTLQWAAATCTGFMRPVYRRDMGGTGKGSLCLDSYGSPSILPVQLPMDNDWQQAYAVTIMDEQPIYRAHAMFPEYQDKLRPTSSKYWYSADIRKAAQGNMFKRMFAAAGGGRGPDSQLSDLFCPIRYTYIIDLSINRTDAMIPMGEFGTSWYYEVPCVGQDLSGGRKASVVDARMYPYRRLIITSEDNRLYDGPAFDWHGRLPLIPICVDGWPWEALGFSLVRDGFVIQESIDSLVRGSMDKHAASLDVALGYDINAVSTQEAKQFDPMQPRARIGFDGSMVDKPFAPVVPDGVMRVEQDTTNFITKLEGDLDYQLGVNQAVQLAKARVMASKLDENALDALAEGPLVLDIGRDMESALSELGQQMKYGVLQNYDTPRIMTYVGVAGMPATVFDYKPTDLIPSHGPGENPDEGASKLSQHTRARIFADNLRFQVDPHTVHEQSQMSQKLLLIQLKKAGVGIDDETLAKAANVPNYGQIDGSTVLEKWNTQQDKQVERQIRSAFLAKALGLEDGLLPPGGAAPPGAPPNPEGRPPTLAAAPTLESKDGGARSTIATSKH